MTTELPPDLLEYVADALFRAEEPAAAVDELCARYPEHATAIRARAAEFDADRDTVAHADAVRQRCSGPDARPRTCSKNDADTNCVRSTM